MSRVLTRLSLLFGLLSCTAAQAAEQLYDKIPADAAPKLSQPGPYAVGVRTTAIEIPNSLHVSSGQSYTRPLTLELWYPANPGTALPADYQDQTRSGKTFRLAGQAWRDAAPATGTAPHPVVVISHGYTGYRSLMFYLAEHLASHGYIVAAIDHTDSTNAEVDFVKAPFSGFLSTLYHRARDQQATLHYLMSSKSPLFAQTHPDKAGLIGYSMGGFGALSTLGACYQFPDAMVQQLTGATQPDQIKALRAQLNSCHAGQAKADPRWQAGILLAPWGGQYQLFSPQSLATIQTPMLFVAGDQDDISGYQGITQLFQQSRSATRYLLTYHGARHNIAAHPAPAVARESEGDYGHYAEPAWDVQQLNRINQHLILAMLDCQLKQKADACQLLPQGNSRSEEGQGWPGLPARYNTGMSWQAGSASQAGAK